MKVLICGSRNWTDKTIIMRSLRHLMLTHEPGLTGELLVIEGEAKGADTLTRHCAEELGIPVKGFPADWDRFGKSAGFKRNIEMLDQNPDLVLAFQLNGSRGTQHTIDEARKRGITVHVFDGRRWS